MNEELWRRILQFLSENGEHPTGEIAKAVGEDSRKVYYNLLRLAGEGLVKLRRITPKIHMWTLTEEGKEKLKTKQS